MDKKPLLDFGELVSFPMMGLDLLLEDTWDMEPAKSSKIEIIPTGGLIVKRKKRNLDSTVYESFATLFFSELFDNYNRILSELDIVMYSPQTLKIQYGEEGTYKSRDSSIYQIFCPGTPLNQIKNSKKKRLKVNSENVRTEERVMYLGGVLSSILLKEGISHNDPQLRHFLLLPVKHYVHHFNLEGDLLHVPSKNGLGVIDVESARILGSYSEEVEKDALKFKDRLFSKFNTPTAERYFTQGSEIMPRLGYGKITNSAFNQAQRMWDFLFPNSKLNYVDMESKKVHYS